MADKAQMNTLSVDELQRWIEESRTFWLIDTLPPDHYERVRLPGAENACVFDVTFLDRLAEMIGTLDQPVVVYGSSARSLDAATAADKLIRAGYTSVYALVGGLDAWRAAGRMLEGSAPGQPTAETVDVTIPEGIYPLDTVRSRIEWAGRNPGTRHHGTVRIAGGQIIAKNGQITGTFDIDMKRIENTNLAGDPLQPVLIGHLESDDFFWVKRFPKARFLMEAAVPMKNPAYSAPNHTVKGRLEMRGVAAELSFSATINRLSDGKISAEAHFDIDRTRWGVVYGSSRFFEHLGMHLVFDPISFQIQLHTR